MSSIVLFNDIAALMEKLPETIPDPQLHYEKMEGKDIEELVAYDKFKIWKDDRGFVRWALRNWPDDGLPLPNHGARRRLEHTIVDCYQHLRLRERIQGG